MKVLIDIRLLARGETTGIQEYACNLLHALMARDEHNDYQLFYNALRKIPLEHQLSLVKSHRVSIIDWHLPNKLLDLASKIFNHPKIDRLTGADVIFSPHFNILAVDHAPRIITFHDLSFLHHPDFFSLRQRFWHWLQSYRRQAQEASKIIAVSEFTKSDLVNLLGVPEQKISVIYSGISSEFKLLSPDLSSRAAVDTPYFLYLGTLEPRKNIPAIIRAFNIVKRNPALKNFRLILAGRPGWLYRDIVKEAHRSSFAKDIIFWGPAKPEDRVLLYNKAVAFVYPSFFEGFGFPPLEAQACGAPVIVADRTSLPEIVGDSAIRVNPWKVDELAQAMEQVAVNDALRRQLTAAGLTNVKRFSWERAAQETLKILNNC